MIGLDVLTRRRVTLDFPERKLYFNEPGAPAPTAPAAPAKAAAKAPAAKPAK